MRHDCFVRWRKIKKNRAMNGGKKMKIAHVAHWHAIGYLVVRVERWPANESLSYHCRISNSWLHAYSQSKCQRTRDRDDSEIKNSGLIVCMCERLIDRGLNSLDREMAILSIKNQNCIKIMRSYDAYVVGVGVVWGKAGTRRSSLNRAFENSAS